MYLAVFLAWPCPAVSSTQEAAATSSRGATLTDFASLAGGWEAHLGPMTAERQWMAPRNGTMQGFFRLTFDNPVVNQLRDALLTRVDGDTYISHGDITEADGKPNAIEVTYHLVK